VAGQPVNVVHDDDRLAHVGLGDQAGQNRVDLPAVRKG
jgi:hypothetical protein